MDLLFTCLGLLAGTGLILTFLWRECTMVDKTDKRTIKSWCRLFIKQLFCWHMYLKYMYRMCDTYYFRCNKCGKHVIRNND